MFKRVLPPRVLPYNFEARVKFHIPAGSVTDPQNAWLRHLYQRDGEPVDYNVRLETITSHCRGRLLNQGC